MDSGLDQFYLVLSEERTLKIMHGAFKKCPYFYVRLDIRCSSGTCDANAQSLLKNLVLKDLDQDGKQILFPEEL